MSVALSRRRRTTFMIPLALMVVYCVGCGADSGSSESERCLFVGRLLGGPIAEFVGAGDAFVGIDPGREGLFCHLQPPAGEPVIIFIPDGPGPLRQLVDGELVDAHPSTP